ncbi:UNVERIFIED_CONTAM: hypothetical protein Sradi_6910700 [Sesamum radiatum]|uniref:Uncharacterized protein n=1 Tax=Sesamum radiatum TaxID=300843 RepID=A0AAW2JHP3_SESRA
MLSGILPSSKVFLTQPPQQVSYDTQKFLVENRLYAIRPGGLVGFHAEAFFTSTSMIGLSRQVSSSALREGEPKVASSSNFSSWSLSGHHLLPSSSLEEKGAGRADKGQAHK